MIHNENLTQPDLRVAEVVGQCFFVGMHNKPGMKPLDSKTVSGKIIDTIIKEVPINCIKTNLCDIDYFPKDENLIAKSRTEWYDKYNPKPDDIIILLGDWVHKNFSYRNFNVIKLGHPAGIFFGNIKRDEYISNAILKINQMI